MAQGLVEVDVQAWDTPGPVHHVDEVAPVGQVGPQHQVLGAAGLQFEHTGVTSNGDRAPVSGALHVLDARDGTRRQVANQRGPVQGAAKRHPQHQTTIGHQPVGRSPAGPQVAGPGAEDVVTGPVELADTAEPGREGHIGHGHVGVVQQSTGEVGAAGSSQLVGSDAHVMREQPPEMTARHSQARRQIVLGAPVQGPVGDELHGPAHQFGAGPPRRLRIAVRAAAEARPETVGFGRRRQGVRANIRRQGAPGTVRPAINARRHDGGNGGHVGRCIAPSAGPADGFGHAIDWRCRLSGSVRLDCHRGTMLVACTTAICLRR